MRDVAHDAGVAQLGEHLGLAREALELARRARILHQLERDRGAGQQVDGFEHATHAAGSGDPPDHETATDHRRRVHSEKFYQVGRSLPSNSPALPGV